MPTSWQNDSAVATSWTPESAASTSWANEDAYLGQSRQTWDSATVTWGDALFDWTGTAFTIWENELSV